MNVSTKFEINPEQCVIESAETKVTLSHEGVIMGQMDDRDHSFESPSNATGAGQQFSTIKSICLQNGSQFVSALTR